jgi:hypothetical protein
MRFEGRELKDYAEPVLPDQLQEGKVYFAVVFLDKDGLVPSVGPRAFIGTKAEPEGNKHYFQDFACYRRGIPIDSPNADEEATLVTGAGRCIFEYDRALDVLLACALRRQRDGENRS